MKLCGNTVPGGSGTCMRPAEFIYWRRGSFRKRPICASCLTNKVRRSREKIFTRPIEPAASLTGASA